jgi:hypothetical protein
VVWRALVVVGPFCVATWLESEGRWGLLLSEATEYKFIGVHVANYGTVYNTMRYNNAIQSNSITVTNYATFRITSHNITSHHDFVPFPSLPLSPQNYT